jgi:hypothetical protein
MKFTIYPDKDYKKDICILKDAIQNRENISFSKFCDGEWAVLTNTQIDNKEFRFDPNNHNDQLKRRALHEAFTYQNERYFIGITCVNVFGIETHNNMKIACKQKKENLTWADIWVNSNYPYFTQNIIPLFNERPVVLFCNENGDVKNLPFKPYIVFNVKNNAWDNWGLIEKSKDVISNFKDSLILFCCGPFGNILCHQLTKHIPNNTYLDIGSTLNPWLKSEGFKRDYYIGNNFFSNMVCGWGDE